jgi:hypothetical protein
VIVGVWALWEIPKQEFTRTEILKTIEAIIGGLGVSSLLLLWAQLRHTAVLGKLTSYHDHFHDLPSIGKVRDLYRALGRCKVEVPTWYTPMSEADREKLFADVEPPPASAELAVREYLNDFEEFAAAIKCGLVDDDYAYRIESTRVLNAHFGFRRWRDLYTWTPSSIDSDSLALLLAHRDQMYRESMTLPVPTQ